MRTVSFDSDHSLVVTDDPREILGGFLGCVWLTHDDEPLEEVLALFASGGEGWSDPVVGAFRIDTPTGEEWWEVYVDWLGEIQLAGEELRSLLRQAAAIYRALPSVPAPQLAPQKKLYRIAWARLLHLGRDILFTFVLPYALLSPHTLHLPALPLSPYWAYALSGLLPSLYLLADTLRRGSLNPFGVFLLAGSLSNAAVSFLRLDGVYFALKDASHSLLLIVACGVSIALKRPLFEFLFYGLLSPETAQQQAQLSQALARPEIRRALAWATACVATKAALLAVISYAVARLTVTLPFGAPGFNTQVAHAHAITFPIYLGLDVLFYGLAFWLTVRAMRGLTGGQAWPWEEGFWVKLSAVSGQLSAQDI